jgi:hypothetical protein
LPAADVIAIGRAAMVRDPMPPAVIVAAMLVLLDDWAAPAGAGTSPTSRAAAAADNRILVRIVLSFC